MWRFRSDCLWRRHPAHPEERRAEASTPTVGLHRPENRVRRANCDRITPRRWFPRAPCSPAQPALAGTTAGTLTVKRAPPSVRLAASTEPSCAATIAATIANPKPVPPVARERLRSTRQNRSKIRSNWSAGRPGPWSRTTSAACPSATSRDISTRLAGGVWVRAFANRLATTWVSWPASPLTMTTEDATSRIGPSRFDRIAVRHRVTHDGGQVDGAVVAHHLGVGQRVEAGQRQQIVDQTTHTGALRTDPVHGPRQLGGVGQCARLVQLGITGDRGQRRAQLVAGVGHEPAQRGLGLFLSREGGVQLVEHLVECAGQPCQLRRRPLGGHPPGSLAVGDRRGGVDHGVHGT